MTILVTEALNLSTQHDIEQSKNKTTNPSGEVAKSAMTADLEIKSKL